MRTTMLAVIIALFATLPLNAGILKRDFLAAGDGLLTYDDVNQREWLDLTYTSGVDLATISNLMASEGILENFEFATLQEVRQLANSGGIEWQDSEESVF